MNKKFLTALCCLTLSISVLTAQNNERGNGGRGGRHAIQLVDTNVTSQLSLSSDKTKAIEDLNTKYAQEVSAMMPQDRSSRPSEDEMKANMEKMKEVRKTYLKQVRSLLGDNLYIQYLEEVSERHNGRPMRGPRGNRGGQQNNDEFGDF